jgi:hypothetical protein
MAAVLSEAAVTAHDLGEIADRLDAHDVIWPSLAKLALDLSLKGMPLLDLDFERRVIRFVSKDGRRLKWPR